MAPLKELLVEQLQKLLFTENRLVGALPKMAQAAHSLKLREGFEKHLVQTKGHVTRLEKAFELLGARAGTKPCKAILGLVAAGEETIEEGQQKDPLVADLALISAGQDVEHYEIAGYGTARTLARQLGETQVATLLSHTLGEEESTDHLLSEFAAPLLQEAAAADRAPVSA